MRLPQIQKRYIAPAGDFAAGSNEATLGAIMQTTGTMTTKITQTQDASKSIRSLSESSQQFNKTLEEYKIQYADKPEEFSAKMTEYKQQLFDDTVKNSDVSLLSRNNFKTLAEKQFNTYDNVIFKTCQMLKESSIKANLDNSVEANNSISYLQGKTGDYNSFIESLSKNILRFKTTGQQVYTPQELNLRLSNLSKEATKNYLDGLIVSNTAEAEHQLSNGNFNNLLSQNEIDKYSALINKAKENVEEVTKEQGTKTERTEILNQALVQLSNRWNDFEVSGKTIQNKKLNNFDSVIDFQNFNEDLYNQGLISKKEFNSYQEKTNKIFKKLLEKEEDYDESISKQQNITPVKYLLRKIQAYVSPLDSEEQIQILRNSYNQAKVNNLLNIKLNEEEANQMHEIVKKNVLLVYANQGYDISEKELKNPYDYLNKTKYERAMQRILAKVTEDNKSNNPFGDLTNLTITPKTKDTSVFVKTKKGN